MTVLQELSVLPPAAAGLFYPAEADSLRADIHQLRRAAARSARMIAGTVRAVLVPHDAYVSSGAVLAAGMLALREHHPMLRRLLIVAPSYRGGFTGFLHPLAATLETPLGRIAVDEELLHHAQLGAPLEGSDRRLRDEPAIEAILPMLQEFFGEVTVAPLLAGTVTPREATALLDAALELEDTAVILSSNLSRGLPLALTRLRNEETAARIESGKPPVDRDAACGSTLLNGLVAIGDRRDWITHRLALSTSADAAGPAHHVTGYGAWAWSEG